MSKTRKICSRCILDEKIPGIRFNEDGTCTYCQIHDELEKKYPLGKEGKKIFKELINKIKSHGKNKKYDCIIGISGGTDSTYCLYMAKKLGLRPLAVHLNNGWNSETADRNMKNLIEKLDVDLRVISVDFEEYKDLQISFLKASVSDAEIPTDVAIYSVLHQAAVDEGIKYVIDAHSFRAEGTTPIGWTYMDGKYIESVHKKFGKLKKLRSYPNLTISKYLYFVFIKRLKNVRFLEYFDYNKEESKKILVKEVGWKYYGGHHFESIYTKFIIWLLWKKFNIDKRPIEYSALVRSKQITRDEALEKMKEDPGLEDNKTIDLVCKKLELSKDDLDDIIKAEPKTFLDYKTNYPMIKLLRGPIGIAAKLNLIPSIFYLKYALSSKEDILEARNR